jgi:hypothetical protein
MLDDPFKTNEAIIDVDSQNDTVTEVEDDMVYLDLDIELNEDFIENEMQDLSVAEILQDVVAAPYDYDIPAKLCEDIPCISHSLDLVATVDFQKVLDAIRPVTLKSNHDEAFGKLRKLWKLSNRSIQSSEIIYNDLGRHSLLLPLFLKTICLY